MTRPYRLPDRWLQPVTRRELLRRAGRGSLSLGALALLAACGVQGQRREQSELEPLPPIAGELNMASWPLYIDKDGSRSPTVDSFEAETDIDLSYKVVINDNEEFFGTIREPLSQGESAGWDLIIMTDWMIAKLIRLGYLEKLHHDRIPNFEANAGEAFKDPSFDPGNQHSMGWAGGITGIGYDISLTGRELTTFDDLFDPAFAGRVGMFSEMRDTFGLTLLSMGIEPSDAAVADVEAAQRKLLEHRDSVRGFYGNDYADQLAAGNLVATVAWSGDVFALALDNPNLRFIVPDSGAMRWTDNMAIPVGAEHPTDAHEFMNYVYDPRIAANITEWVWYTSPVGQTQQTITEDAEAAPAKDADFLRQIAESTLVFPDAETEAQTHVYKTLDEEEEQIWNELFQTLVQG